MNKDSLGDRMKGYENAYRMYLPRRLKSRWSRIPYANKMLQTPI